MRERGVKKRSVDRSNRGRKSEKWYACRERGHEKYVGDGDRTMWINNS